MKLKTTLLAMFTLATSTSALAADGKIDLAEHKQLGRFFPNYKAMALEDFKEHNSAFFALFKKKDQVGADVLFSAGLSDDRAEILLIDMNSTCKSIGVVRNVVLTVHKEPKKSQKVKFKEACDGVGYYYSPSTQRGNEFLIDAFTYTDFIKIDGLKTSLIFDTDGFAQILKDFKDAI